VQRSLAKVLLARAAAVTIACVASLVVLAPTSTSAAVRSHAGATHAAPRAHTVGFSLEPGPRQGSRITAHIACSGACVIASAAPQWACDIEGAVVGAGIAIAFPEASAAWAILGQTAWTVGCDVVPADYLDAGQVSALRMYEARHQAVGCFYVRKRGVRRRMRTIKCAGVLA
jgi:hypothetical protein